MISWGYPEEKLIDSLCIAAMGYLSVNNDPNNDLYLCARKIINSEKRIPRGMNIRQTIAFFSWKIDERFFYFICRVSRRL